MDGLWASVSRPLLWVGLLVLLACLLCLAGYLLTLTIWSAYQVRRRAQHDYRTARGTQHLRQLRAAVSVLRDALHSSQNRIGDLERQLARLQAQRSQELNRALSERLATQRLTEVRGIGATLSRRVIQHCFRGSLGDLHSAYRVEGIGSALQSAISAWVRERQAEFPALLARGFPGKQEIEAKYAQPQVSLGQQLNSERATLERANQLHEIARQEIARFQQVGPAHFRRALRRNDRETPVPAWYLEGVYRPWEPMPDWFRRLLEDYGG